MKKQFEKLQHFPADFLIDDWNKYFLKIAALVARKSKDANTRIGCVLVRDKAIISTGYNGICRGVKETAQESERFTSPLKYLYFEHAERNAIYNAASRGICTSDSTMYLIVPPCADCGRAIIQSGIKNLVLTRFVMSHHNYEEAWKHVCNMFDEAGINVTYYEGLLDETIYINGVFYKI